jgi:hypothetical protein
LSKWDGRVGRAARVVQRLLRSRSEGQMNKERIKGMTVRWTFDDGPMAGKTFEHTFEQNGTVKWRGVGDDAKSQGAKEPTEASYIVEPLHDDVFVVSYLGSSGYTLTSVLDFKSQRMVAIASNEKQIVAQRGTFEEVKRAA